MTVGTLLGMQWSQPPPNFDISRYSNSIQIPSSRRRHPSLGSTGSYEGSSSAGSPPLQDLLALQLSQHILLPTSPKSKSQVTDTADTAQKNVNPTRYKTELCRPFEESGYCKYGEKCQFAHGIKEVRSLSRHPKYKTELCRTYHSVGFCPYGPRCHFIHNEDELKLCQINQQKQQQILQQIAQHVAQQEALCKINSHMSRESLALSNQQSLFLPHAHKLQSIDYLPLFTSMIDMPGSSSTDNTPSMSPSSIFSPESVFSRMATPPPGFTVPPPGLPTHTTIHTTPLNTFTSALDVALPSPTGTPDSSAAPRASVTDQWQYWPHSDL